MNFVLQSPLIITAARCDVVRNSRLIVVVLLGDRIWASESHLALVHRLKSVACEVLLSSEWLIRVLHGGLSHAEQRHLIREAVGRICRSHEFVARLPVFRW